MTSFDYSGVMWAEATRDYEAEAAQELQLRGKLATAAFWPFLAAAESETDFGHRLVLIEDRIAAVVAPPVLDSVLASVASDWKLLHTARLEASAQAEQEGLRQTEAHRAAQPQQVRADDEIFDVSQGRWVRVSYIDPSDAQRYSHYPNMNPPVDNGPLQGPDGFVTGGEGDAGRSDAVIQQRQLTPGQWTVTPGTEWPVRPNAADPSQAPRTAAAEESNPYTTGERSQCRSCNGWGRFEGPQCPTCSDCGGKGYIEHKRASHGSLHTSDRQSERATVYHQWATDQGHNPDDLSTLKLYQKQPGISAAHANEIADIYHGEDDTWRQRRTSRRQAAAQLPPLLRQILSTGQPRPEFNALVQAYPHLQALATAPGFAPVPTGNPNYFSQGSEGIAGPPTFPENPSSAIEPKTDNRMDDLYGAVPPQASSGSAQGLVDGQGYSKQVPGSSATAGRRPFDRTAGGFGGSEPTFKPGDRVQSFRGEGATVHRVHPSQDPGKSHRVQVRWDDPERNLTWDGQEHPEGAGDQQAYYEHAFSHHPDTVGGIGHMVDQAVPHSQDIQRAYSSKQAGTNGRIVGHCDNCSQPVRYHTGENGVDELRHLHNNHNSCSNGRKAASLRRSTAFFDPKDATVRVLADGMTRARPTLDNPSGAGDEYDANTWNNAVTQRPMQSAQDRGINTPTQPRDPIGTVSSEPGHDDDDDRNQNGMARETSLAARSIEELMES